MTVTDYLTALPADRAAELRLVRAAIRKALPKGYEEAVAGKVIAYQVPLAVYPDTYNKQPLGYVALASQKNYLSLHLMPVYGDKRQEQRLRDAFAAKGKKLDMGKACIRFKRADDLDLDVIGDIVASTPMERWVEIAKSVRRK